MQHFSSIYEKLIDMGFGNDAIDGSIKKGFYTFDMIFNDLVETDQDLRAYSEENNFNKQGIICQPVLKLRANPYDSIYEGVNEDKFMEMTMRDATDSYQISQPVNVEGDLRFRMPSKLHWSGTGEHNEWTETNAGSINPKLRMESSNQRPRADRKGRPIADSMVTTEAISSTLSSSSILSGSGETPMSAATNGMMTKIQIMDLLDPALEPVTFSHPFLAGICTIRDLICWFHQCRYSTNRISKARRDDVRSSQLAIASDTSLNQLIEQFQQLRWHFVMPSGAQSTRIVGEHYLDRSIGSLGLHPSAHLLAIVSCPSQLQRQSSMSHSSTHSCLTAAVNGNHSNAVAGGTNGNCSLQIDLIDSATNKIDYRLNCDPDRTTLQNIAADFSRIRRIDIGTFTLLRQEPKQMFSYPEDYARTLSDLGMHHEHVSMCWYRLDRNWLDNNTSSNHANNSSGVPIQAPSPPSSPVLPIRQFDSIEAADELLRERTIAIQPFSGTGIPLPGCHDDRSVAELWANRSFESCSLEILPTARCDRRPKSLLHLCFKEIYRLLRVHSNATCRSMKKLPNNIQQIFIKFLLDDKLLTPSLLSYFCAVGSNLTTLDLSYSLLATNEVLKCISKCSSLEELILDNEEHTFSNEGLWHLRYLSRLKRLSLNYCAKINDWGIQVVGALPSLTVLAIKYTSVTNVGLKHIYLQLNSQNSSVDCVPPLRSIDLSGLTVSDECMACIGMFTQLELLNLSSSHLTNPLSFPRLPELRHLDISHCHKLSWETQLHVKSLCDSFPKLSSINVRGVSNSNLVHVTMAIAHCKFIRQLDGIFCHPQMTASLAASLSHLPLETVILTNCHHVTDLWLPVLARFSATLTHLVLSSCSGLTGDNNSILNNLSRLRNLSWLDLTHLDNIDSAQICQLVLGNHFPKLQVVWISLTDQKESEFKSQSQHLNFKVNVTKSLLKQFNCGGLSG